MKYRLSEIARICGGCLLGEDVTVADVVTDSRSCAFADGAMFVAMRGVNHDSHDNVAEMYRRGVRGFMVERADAAAIPCGAGYVVVGVLCFLLGVCLTMLLYKLRDKDKNGGDK